LPPDIENCVNEAFGGNLVSQLNSGSVSAFQVGTEARRCVEALQGAPREESPVEIRQAPEGFEFVPPEGFTPPEGFEFVPPEGFTPPEGFEFVPPDNIDGYLESSSGLGQIQVANLFQIFNILLLIR